MAERVRFELTCRNYPTIRFRVGAVMTASVPLRARNQEAFLENQGRPTRGAYSSRAMSKAKGRKNLTSRRGFVAWAMVAVGSTLWTAQPAKATDAPKAPVRSPVKAGAHPAAPPGTHAPAQRARLPRRLAADFHTHIETRLP